MAFKQLIKDVLSRANLLQSDIDWIADRHIDLYQRAFTSIAYDPNSNYEELEQKGDASANAFLVWYFYKRFPQLNCSAGVPVIARLKIVYSSKTTFYKIAKKLGFWPFIRATANERDSKEKSLLEDVFEAFVGATQEIFDDKYQLGFGFVIVSRILTSLFDEIDISLEHQDLYDAKTRLKEYFDTNKSLGMLTTEYDANTRVVTLSTTEPHKPKYVSVDRLQEFLKTIDPKKSVNITIKNGTATVMYEGIGKQLRKLAEAKAMTKAEAEQKASQKALEILGVKPKKKVAMVCAQ